MLQELINRILGGSKHSDIIKRGCLERTLRYVVLDQKDKFRS